MSLASDVADRFLNALGERDFSDLASCFGDGARFRALVPSGLREAVGADEATALFQRWFGSHERIKLAKSAVEQVAERQHLTWRLIVADGAERQVVEQQAFATVRDNRIVRMELVCSGFLPLAPNEDQSEQPTLNGGESDDGRLSCSFSPRV